MLGARPRSWVAEADVRRAGASSVALSIASAGEHDERGGWIQLSNGHAWSPADLSMVTLQLSRRLDAANGASGEDMDRRARANRGDAGGLRLVSQLSFAEEQRNDPEGCAAALGDAGSVPPGSQLTLWQGARCSFAFLPLRQGDRVQLLHGARSRHSRLQASADVASAGDTVVDDYSVPAAAASPSTFKQGDEASKPSRVRDRRLAGDAVSATGNSQASAALTTQDLAAAFASFAAVGATSTPAASTASIVAPRRSADAGTYPVLCLRYRS